MNAVFEPADETHDIQHLSGDFARQHIEWPDTLSSRQSPAKDTTATAHSLSSAQSCVFGKGPGHGAGVNAS